MTPDTNGPLHRRQALIRWLDENTSMDSRECIHVAGGVLNRLDELSAPSRDIPEGWVMVPREPDAGLVLTGMDAFDDVFGSGQPMDLAVAHAWRTMLGLCERRAAPPAPETT